MLQPFVFFWVLEIISLPSGAVIISLLIMTVVCQNLSGRRGKIYSGCKSCLHLSRNGGSGWYLRCWCVWSKLTNNGFPWKSTSGNGKYSEPSSVGKGHLRVLLRIMNISQAHGCGFSPYQASWWGPCKFPVFSSYICSKPWWPWWLMFKVFIFKLPSLSWSYSFWNYLQNPETRAIIPTEFLGVKLVSFGFAGQGRAIMRGPMVSGVIDQLLTTTEW